jgi:hypothetical protein
MYVKGGTITNVTAITKKIKPVSRRDWYIVTDLPVKSLQLTNSCLSEILPM